MAVEVVYTTALNLQSHASTLGKKSCSWLVFHKEKRHWGQQRAREVRHRGLEGEQQGRRNICLVWHPRLITSNTWTRKMTDWTGGSADCDMLKHKHALRWEKLATLFLRQRVKRFDLIWHNFHLVLLTQYWTAVTWKFNHSSTQLKHHLMYLNPSSWH